MSLRVDERKGRKKKAGAALPLLQVFVKHLVHPTWLWAAHRVGDRDHHPPEGAPPRYTQREGPSSSWGQRRS